MRVSYCRQQPLAASNVTHVSNNLTVFFFKDNNLKINFLKDLKPKFLFYLFVKTVPSNISNSISQNEKICLSI